jgi:peptide/nickel transport system substrate-binding protein
LKNADLRLALQKSIDKELLISQFTDKKVVDTPLMELSQEDWVYKPSKEEAEGALKDAGYSYGEDDTEHLGIRYGEDESALELRLVARLYEDDANKFEEVKKVVTFLQESWESIGFDIQVDLLPLGEFEERIMRRDYDLLLLGQNLGYNLDTYSYWHSTQASPIGQNLSNYKSFQVDSLIEDIRSVFNLEKRARELNELAEQIKKDFPAIFLYRPVYYYATDSKVSGISMDGIVFPSDRFFNMYLWKFDR